MPSSRCSSFFFFNDTATTEIYTLSLHDALPISQALRRSAGGGAVAGHGARLLLPHQGAGGVRPGRDEAARAARGLARRARHGARDEAAGVPHAAALLERSAGRVGRSEERRVGKEGRSRWSPYH